MTTLSKRVKSWAHQSAALSIHAFDQRETLLGQGTIGLEMEEQSPDIDTLLVAVGGGRLIAGIAGWFGGEVRVVGVEPEASPTLTMALQAGGPVDAPVGGIAADSLAPRRVGTLVYPIAKRHVDHVALVADDAINRAQLALWEALRMVTEPGGAVGFAALVSGRYEPRAGEHVGILVSGGNTTAVNFG
ncbi:MAG: pyridoxal-phosphate dependent enzyme [Stellaceae bacterium]